MEDEMGSFRIKHFPIKGDEDTEQPSRRIWKVWWLRQQPGRLTRRSAKASTDLFGSGKVLGANGPIEEQNMKTKLETQRPANATVLKVVIVYGELSSGKSGKELCDRVGRHLGRGCKLQLVPWSLSVLRIPEIMQAAATVASGASLIVVAAGLAELSVAVVRRIRRLIKHPKNSHRAMVVLIHCSPESSLALVQVCALLRQAAREAGMAFFWQMNEHSECGPSYSLDAIHEGASRHTALLDPIVQRT
jgi:hypothetical protein